MESLKNMGFNITVKEVYEKNLDGVRKKSLLLRALSNNQKLIITLRIYDDNSCRVQVIAILSDTSLEREELVDELESLGFIATFDNDRLSASLTTRLEDAFNKALESVSLIKDFIKL